MGPTGLGSFFPFLSYPEKRGQFSDYCHVYAYKLSAPSLRLIATCGLRLRMLASARVEKIEWGPSTLKGGGAPASAARTVFFGFAFERNRITGDNT
jgi:hypothetical protein